MIIVRYFLWVTMGWTLFAKCADDREQKKLHEIIHKLHHLGELRPIRCRSEAENMPPIIPYPRVTKESHEQRRILVLAVSFNNVSELFMKNTTLTEWDPNELRKLKDLLGQQREFYQKMAAVSSTDVEDVRTFWRSLDNYLTEKGFSSCAWESARPVILQVMCNFYKSRRHTRKHRGC